MNITTCALNMEKIEVIVKWDTDGEEIDDLPNVVEIPPSIEEDEVADYLSDEYGWCVESWEYNW